MCVCLYRNIIMRSIVHINTEGLKIMMDKIDIHSHIIYGVDDGSKDIEESIAMLKMLVNQGFSAVVATPHYSRRYRNDEPKKLIDKAYALQQAVREEIGPDFQIYLGQEIFYSDDVVDLLDEGKLLTYVGGNHLLIEFHPSTPYSTITNAVKRLFMKGYRPVIAHIERYEALRTDGRVEDLIEMGALTQMNYGEVGAHWYNQDTRWCRRILKEQKVNFLATDMHNIGDRKPDTQAAIHWMEKSLDNNYIEAICSGNAKKLLNHQKI